MRCHATSQIGQPESRLPVAAIGRAQQREQRRILRDRKELAIANRPAARREVSTEHPDFAYKRVHVPSDVTSAKHSFVECLFFLQHETTARTVRDTAPPRVRPTPLSQCARCPPAAGSLRRRLTSTAE